MQPDWGSFLSNVGAIIADDRVLHFGAAERELRAAVRGDILCDLSHQGLISAAGPDSGVFLQGQVTNDVRQVTPEHSQLNAHCSPKGRMLACFRLFQRGDSYYLRMPAERVEPILKRLGIFILRAKTALADASDELLRLGVAGPNAEAILTNLLGKTPPSLDEVVATDTTTVVRIPGPEHRFELYGPPERLRALWVDLSADAMPVGATPWRLLDILAGIPNVYTETADAFVPQMLNLQLLNGVSFQKGCYTGQEIVARTHYLGKLKRRMYRAHGDAPTCPRPGEELFSPATAPNQSAGKVVDACPHPDGGYELLVTVLIECAHQGMVHMGNNEGPALQILPPPYALEPGSP